MDGLPDLHRELARGDEDEDRGASPLEIHGRVVSAVIGRGALDHASGHPRTQRGSLDQGQSEGRRLPGARRRLAEDVAPLEENGNRRALDGRGFLVPERGKRGRNARVETEFSKCGGLGVFGHVRLPMRRCEAGESTEEFPRDER